MSSPFSVFFLRIDRAEEVGVLLRGQGAVQKRGCALRSMAKSRRTPMPKFVKIILACLICLAVAGGLIWLVNTLG